MEKNKYKGLRAIFIITEIFLIGISIFLISKVVPVYWKTNDKFAATITSESGQMRAITAPSYVKWWQIRESIFDLIGKAPFGDTYIGTERINNQLKVITIDYIKEYGMDTKVSLNVNFATDNDLSYTISGSPTGEMWEVWVSFENAGNPQILVLNNAEVQS